MMLPFLIIIIQSSSSSSSSSSLLGNENMSKAVVMGIKRKRLPEMLRKRKGRRERAVSNDVGFQLDEVVGGGAAPH